MGEPILKYSLKWSSNLIRVVDDLIYLVGLLPNSKIEIKTIEPQLEIQTIELHSRNCKKFENIHSLIFSNFSSFQVNLNI